LLSKLKEFVGCETESTMENLTLRLGKINEVKGLLEKKDVLATYYPASFRHLFCKTVSKNLFLVSKIGF